MADFRNPRNKERSLPPSFGGSISGEGSYGEKGTVGNLSAEVSGRTKSGITGGVNVDVGGSRNKPGTSGFGDIRAAIGYQDRKYRLEAEGDLVGGSFFLSSDDLKQLGINNASNISKAQLRELRASITDVFGSGAQDELSISVRPRNNFKDGVDGAMVRYKLKF
jgi:hypothetical protein